MKPGWIKSVLERNWHMGTSILFLAPMVAVIPTGSVQAAGEDNNLHLYGALVAEPCIIPVGEDEIALDFGGIADKYLYQNTRSPGQEFTLHLADCDLSLGAGVKMTFMGTESTALPGLLAVNSGSGTRGIAIGLETPEAKAVAINKASEKFLLQAGDNYVPFKAYVQGEPEAISNRTITPGTFTATATFNLEYE